MGGGSYSTSLCFYVVIFLLHIIVVLCVILTINNYNNAVSISFLSNGSICPPPTPPPRGACSDELIKSINQFGNQTTKLHLVGRSEGKVDIIDVQCDAIRWKQLLEILSWTALTWHRGMRTAF